MTVGRSQGTDPASSGFGSAHISGPPFFDEVAVTTYNSAGPLADRAFMVEITC